MLFKQDDNWKKYLGMEDEEHLNDLLRKSSRHRGAYKNSDDVKMAQMWCAMLEMRKENIILQKRLRRMEEFFDSILEKHRKHEREKLELVESLEKF
ncbi:MAG: hypothetical protein HYW27_00995 [Candidatus Aenigmarchaeota archaeon]|nr:hypothetical protein [Candidatus Aenigmarchaeota archaeon]